MLFNSIDFAIFLPIVFFVYWFILKKNIRVQNLLLLAASYVFYGWWDWRFLSLIFIISGVDYLVGIGLDSEKSPKKRKCLLLVSLCVNIGLLGFFKYFNYFVDTFVQTFSFCGVAFQPQRLNIILPVGISFYTFQTLSYSIDVYRKRIKSTRDIVAFFAFVAFFPQLVAGPIERAANLLSQFFRKWSFEYARAVDGLLQILWGLFKKIVIADKCAVYVSEFYNTIYHLDYRRREKATLTLIYSLHHMLVSDSPERVYP